MTENKRFDSIYYEKFCRVITDNGKEINPLEVVDLLNSQEEIITEQKEYLTRMGQGNHLKTIMEQKERIKELEQFINKLTTDGTGMIYLANGYAYKVSAVLTDYEEDGE